MRQKLKYTAISILFAIILIVLVRIITLLSLGFSINTGLQQALTPFGETLVLKCLGGLVLVIFFGFAGLPYLNDSYQRYSKSKVIAIMVSVVAALVLLSWQVNKWFVRTDQVEEYNYEVPDLVSKAQAASYSVNGLLKGASVFGWETVTEKSFKNLEELGINTVALMPFEYQISAKDPSINHVADLTDFRPKDSTFIKLTALCKAKHLTVMIKPHLWIESGWRDEIKFEKQEDWDAWFMDYSKIIIQYAKVAETGGADILCIGTELLDSVKKQPEQWIELIADIRKVYSGKLTYAANWDEEYKSIPFWDALDYIGIQAYYPMKVDGDVSKEALQKAVKPYLDTLSTVSRQFDKKVLFTEFGYRSIVNNYQEPWAWPTDWDIFTRVYSEESQAMAYKALLSAVIGQKWFAGGFIWEYDFNEDDGPQALQRLNYSPRYKETEKVIRELYKKNSSKSD